MAKIRFENGVVVNFDGTPTQQDVEEVARNLNIDKGQSSIPFLPKLQETERKIGEREDLLSKVGSAFTRPKTTLEKFIPTLQPTTRIGEAGLNLIGGLSSRYLSGIAKPAIELQKGAAEKFMQKPSFGSFMNVQKKVGKASLEGLTGKSQAQLGDVIRTTGFGGMFNEPLSATTGFMASVGLTNLATKGKLLEGTKQVKDAVVEAQKAAALKNSTKFAQKSDELFDGAKTVLKSLDDEADELYKVIGDNKISPQSEAVVQDIVNRAPKTIISQLKESAKVTGKGPVTAEMVESGKKVVLKNNLNTVKNIKTTLGRNIDWKKLDMADEIQAKLVDDYFKLRDIIAQNAGDSADDLMNLNARYKKMFDYYSTIRKLTRKPGTNITSTSLRNIRQPSMEGEYREIVNFSKQFFPEAEAIVKDIDRLNRNIAIKKGLGTAAKYGIGLEAGRRLLINPLLRSIGGGERY